MDGNIRKILHKIIFKNERDLINKKLMGRNCASSPGILDERDIIIMSIYDLLHRQQRKSFIIIHKIQW